jgi:hypothetical protein
MTRIGAPYALFDGSLCHLYPLNLAQAYLAASLCELTEAFVLLFSLTRSRCRERAFRMHRA